MKNNVRRIRALLKMFNDIDKFYVITSGRYDNSLQAEYNSDLVKEIIALRFVNKGIDRNGHTEFIRGNIRIILT